MRPGPYSAHASDDLIAHEKAPPRRGFFDKETQRDRLAPPWERPNISSRMSLFGWTSWRVGRSALSAEGVGQYS